MGNILSELEKTIMDQIEKLNDDSIGEDAEAAKIMIERSKAMSDLTKNYVEINRLKLDIVKECNSNGGLYEQYLGIEEKK